jgi:hypothetical protein
MMSLQSSPISCALVPTELYHFQDSVAGERPGLPVFDMDDNLLS